MAYDFQGSIAQKYVQFKTQTITTAVVGANYGKVMVFVDEADAITFFVVDPGVDTITEVTSTNYASITKGLLKTWLDGFYLSGSGAPVELVTVLDASGTFDPADLAAQFLKHDEVAYWKTAIGATTAHNIANNVHLASLCAASDELSQYFYGSNDPNLPTAAANNEAFQFIGSKLTGITGTLNSTTSVTAVATVTPNQGWVGSGISGTNITAGTTITAVSGTTLTLSQAATSSGTGVALTLDFDYDVPIVYHPSASLNGALVELGASLAALNNTGTYVGNKLDYLTISGFSASGTAGANLSATQCAALAGILVSFFSTLGDTTGDVMLESGVAGRGWTTPKLANVGARWMTSYCDITSSILCTEYLGQPGRFKNNDTYQGCLLILTGQLSLFSDIGRLSNLKITAPTFDKLPAAGGGIITVPNAWTATYNDNVRSVTVYGTLYLQA